MWKILSTSLAVHICVKTHFSKSEIWKKREKKREGVESSLGVTNDNGFEILTNRTTQNSRLRVNRAGQNMHGFFWVVYQNYDGKKTLPCGDEWRGSHDSSCWWQTCEKRWWRRLVWQSDHSTRSPPPSWTAGCPQSHGRCHGRTLHGTWPVKSKTRECSTAHCHVMNAHNIGLIVGCLTSQQYASVSQGRVCKDNYMCCHTEIEVADQTFYLTQSQYTDAGQTSPSADPIMPGAWQGRHWSANF